MREEKFVVCHQTYFFYYLVLRRPGQAGEVVVHHEHASLRYVPRLRKHQQIVGALLPLEALVKRLDDVLVKEHAAGGQLDVSAPHATLRPLHGGRVVLVPRPERGVRANNHDLLAHLRVVWHVKLYPAGRLGADQVKSPGIVGIDVGDFGVTLREVATLAVQLPTTTTSTRLKRGGVSSALLRRRRTRWGWPVVVVVVYVALDELASRRVRCRNSSGGGAENRATFTTAHAGRAGAEASGDGRGGAGGGGGGKHCFQTHNFPHSPSQLLYIFE